MKPAITHPLKQLLLLGSLLGLTGCMNNIKPLDFAQIEAADSESEGAISVEQLLAQARNQPAGAAPANSNLYLRFEQDQRTLTSKEKQQLVSFVGRSTTPLLLDCAPGSQQDRFAAAAIAVQRCQQISQFLLQESIASEMKLAPKLQADQVRVSR